MSAIKNIAIMAGGNSSEEEISLRGARQIASWLNPSKYKAYTIIVKGKSWTLKHPEHGDLLISKDTFTATTAVQTICFDCALIAIHGTPGENGLLQAYFELMEIPYTTGGVMNASVTFDKEAAKFPLQSLNIKLAQGLRISKGQTVHSEEIVNTIGLPLFVKPNESGSSFGVSKVKKEDELIPALQKAFTEDKVALVEEFIPGRELTCGLVKAMGKCIIFPVTEIITKTEFFDFEAKYKNLSEEITPAQIPYDLSDYIQDISSEIYDRLKCRGIVRMDYIYNEKKGLYFLEVNTVPGMSEASIIPQQASKMGLAMGDIFSLVIEDAIERART
jgi:D-alanine-D-alanine ligase